jgi:hypothetical protein
MPQFSAFAVTPPGAKLGPCEVAGTANQETGVEKTIISLLNGSGQEGPAESTTPAPS